MGRRFSVGTTPDSLLPSPAGSVPFHNPALDAGCSLTTWPTRRMELPPFRFPSLKARLTLPQPRRGHPAFNTLAKVPNLRKGR